MRQIRVRISIALPLIALAMSLLASGCVLSVEPVIPESEAISDDRLIGTWQEDSGDQVVVRRTNDRSYHFEYLSDGEVSYFMGRLGTLGDQVVLDVSPDPRDGDLPEQYMATMLPGHLLMTAEIGVDSIVTRTIRPDSMYRALISGQVELSYVDHTDEPILLSSTRDLQAELAMYLDLKDVLTEGTTWKRSASPAEIPSLPDDDAPCLNAAAWVEADQLFSSDLSWLGADGASSIDLGNGRIIWLFGDTWIDPDKTGERRNATLVSNSLALQTGADPTSAQIQFFVGSDGTGQPSAFFSTDRGRLWPGSGVRVDDRLLLFFNRVVGDLEGLGFDSDGWLAKLVENPDDDPPYWQVRDIPTPANDLGIILGFAAALIHEGYVYAFGSQDPVKSHPVFVARWPVERARDGDLLNPEWWSGDRIGWIPDSSRVRRWPLFNNGASELSVHFDAGIDRFVIVHTTGFGQADLALRTAPVLTGPWSRPVAVYRPPEYDQANRMVYSAKAHPEVEGADIVVTYSTNAFKLADHITDSLVYYPRFVRLNLCE